MTATILPDNPTWCFVPVEDAEVGVHQIRIVVDGMDTTIGTSLVTLGIDEAMAVADKLNRPLGWIRESWTEFAATRLGRVGDTALH